MKKRYGKRKNQIKRKIQRKLMMDSTDATDGMKEKKEKASIEALLFATNGLTIEEISRRTGIPPGRTKRILEELELENFNDSRGVHIEQQGNIWKMAIKPEMVPQLADLLPPEFPKSLLKTLAIIAAKKPVKQSLIVKIRGNKAYDHIKKLEKLGFITSEKKGTTMLLDLTQSFFNYFQLNEIQIKDKFKLDEETEKAVEKAEIEIAAEEKATLQKPAPTSATEEGVKENNE
jgi:segregation and condensation protein B